MKAGYLKFTTCPSNICGTPNGTIISPILANIFFHETDKRIFDLIKGFNIGIKSPATKEFRRLTRLIYKFRDAGNRTELVKTLRMRDAIKASDFNSDKFKQMKFIRYADSILIGIKGTHKDCEFILNHVKSILNELNININANNFKILNHNRKRTKFLGVRFRRFQHQLRVKSCQRGRFIRKRVSKQIKFEAPINKIMSRLTLSGFITKSKPSPKLA